MLFFYNRRLVSDNYEKVHKARTKRFMLLLIPYLAALLIAHPGEGFAETIEHNEISLDEALEEVMVKNYRIAAAEVEVRQHEAAVREARSTLLPKLVALGDYTKNEEQTLVSPMHGSPEPANPLEFDRDIYTGVLRLDIPIIDLASLHSVGATRHMLNAGKAQASIVEQNVIAGVIEVFVQMAQLSDSLALMDSHITTLKRRHEELETLSREGRVSPASLAELTASLDSAISDRLEILYQKDVVAYRLGEMLGRSEAVYPRNHGFSVSAIDKDDFDEKTISGPGSLAADAQYAAAQEAKKSTLSAFAPRLSGFASQTFRASAETDIASEWALGLSVSMPLFTGGERAAHLQSAEARLKAARYELDAARTNEQSEAQIAMLRSDNAASRREYLAKAVENQELTVQAAEFRYSEGRSSLSDVLTEEAALLELRLRERSMLYEELLSYVAYYKLAGKLTPSLAGKFIQE
ncbi:hypothetical protein B4O97_16910 [Marispirochaeta aestuarii]|uniref:Transporter n=2 Tax=Marispirochaeta aestuarii TaxID=1963862 RepID=A0A1Y1RU68_9SPIO|nr:hypothetical protein B4O97_16910 [Marispirochaeta aestuarii]